VQLESKKHWIEARRLQTKREKEKRLKDVVGNVKRSQIDVCADVGFLDRSHNDIFCGHSIAINFGSVSMCPTSRQPHLLKHLETLFRENHQFTRRQ
jgi:hypothetical protein